MEKSAKSKEWDWDVAKEVWQEEAREDAREELFALLESGMSVAEAKEALNLKKDRD